MPSRLPPLQLLCLGPPTARVGGEGAPREVLWQKNLALLLYLALAPDHRGSRDDLLGLLWAERPEEKARGSLNEALFRLRRALGEARLLTDGEVVVLEGAALEVDAVRFAQLVHSDPDAALQLWRGEFLQGFHIEDGEEFEDWAARERTRYRALASAAFVEAGERRLSVSRFTEAADLARRGGALDSRGELPVRVLMRACALGGDATGALAAYHDFEQRLTRETGERPSKALTALADRIRSQSWLPRRALDQAPEPQLVGHEREQREAFETVSQGVVRGPRALVITGPPGTGCTRLLKECRDRLSLEGAVVFSARAVEQDQDAPWSTLRLLLRAGLCDAPGIAGARRESLAAVAGLVPELAARFPPRQVKDIGDMASAVADIVGALAQDHPLGLALDDAQWADGSTIAALASAIGMIEDLPFVLLITVTHGVSEAPPELLSLLTDVGRRVPGTTVRLGALSTEQLAVLVRVLAPWCKNEGERDRLTRRIAFETAGNAFFAVTLLRALAAKVTTFREDLIGWPPAGETTGAPLPFSVPSIVIRALAMRLGELTREHQRLLAAASVGGQALDLELIAAIADVSQAELEMALLEFERHHLVMFDGRRYVFAAPLVREAVRGECLPKGERRRLERRAIDVLAQRTDLESRALRAELRAHADQTPAALEFAATVAEEAIEANAIRLAQRTLAAAERLSVSDADHARVAELGRRLRKPGHST